MHAVTRTALALGLSAALAGGLAAAAPAASARPGFTAYLAHGPILSELTKKCLTANDAHTHVSFETCVAIRGPHGIKYEPNQTWISTVLHGSFTTNLAGDVNACLAGLPWYADYAGIYNCANPSPGEVVRQGIVYYGGGYKPGFTAFALRSLKTRQWLTESSGNALWQRGPTFLQRLRRQYPDDQLVYCPLGFVTVIVD